MRIRSILSLTGLTAFLAFASCSEVEQNQSAENSANEEENTEVVLEGTAVEVLGTIKNSEAEKIRIDRLHAGQVINVDNVEVDDAGNFTWQSKIPESGIYQLSFSEGQVQLFLTEGTVKLEIDGEQPDAYSVSGSKDSEILKSLYKMLHEQQEDVQHFRQRMMNPESETAAKQLEDSLPFYQSQIKHSFFKRVSEFYEKHPESLVPLIAMDYLDPRDYPDFMTEVKQHYAEIYPNHSMVAAMRTRLERNLYLANGRFAPEMELKTPEGESVALSSLRGKIVYIDFWAAWCMPCRREHPLLRELYDEYRDKGFEIYAVNLDETREAWVRAIEEDRIEWLQIADPNHPGMNSHEAQLYQVTSIPNTYLLDEEGKIIARNIRGQALKNKLKELL
jgi:thiol-disulfide isomerase/thioredoxin